MSSIFRLYLSGTTLDSLRWIGRWNDGDFPSPRAKCTHPGAGGPHRWGLSAPLCQKNAIEIVQKFEEHCEIFLGQFVHNTQRMELLAWQPPPSKTNFIRGRKHFGGGKYPSSPTVLCKFHRAIQSGGGRLGMLGITASDFVGFGG